MQACGYIVLSLFHLGPGLPGAGAFQSSSSSCLSGMLNLATRRQRIFSFAA
jgi:hypothetical protein